EVVIEIREEQSRTRIGAFEVMPGIAGHEELAIVAGIVIAMRTRLVDQFAWYTIPARTWGREFCFRSFRACPMLGDRDLHERFSVERALARTIAHHKRLVSRAPPLPAEPRRHSPHPADRALAPLARAHARVT